MSDMKYEDRMKKDLTSDVNHAALKSGYRRADVSAHVFTLHISRAQQNGLSAATYLHKQHYERMAPLSVACSVRPDREKASERERETETESV